MQRAIYSDRWMILVGVPILSFILRHMGEPMAVIDLFQGPGYYQDAAFYLVEVLLLWGLNRALIHWLDGHYSWAKQALQRFFIQTILTFGLTSLLVLLLSFAYYDLFIRRPEPFNINNIFSADVPTSLLLVTIIHMLYTGQWMVCYHQYTIKQIRQSIAQQEASVAIAVEEPLPQSKGNFRRTLLVNQGKGLVPIPAEQVAYIFITHEISIVKTGEGHSFTINASLDQLTDELDPHQFFRVSRQLIVHHSAIKRVEKESNGRLLLQLEPAHSEEVAVSRRRVPEFRQWMNG